MMAMMAVMGVAVARCGYRTFESSLGRSLGLGLSKLGTFATTGWESTRGRATRRETELERGDHGEG